MALTPQQLEQAKQIYRQGLQGSAVPTQPVTQKVEPIKVPKQKKKFLAAVSDSFGKALDFGAKTFIDPVARELIRPFVNVRAGLTGNQSPVKTPFGDVKSFANLNKVVQGQTAKEQGALQPGEAAMGAVDVLTSGPEGTLKTLVKPGAKMLAKATTGVGTALKEGAIRTVENALLRGGGSKAAKLTAQKIAPEILDRGMSGSAKGLSRLAQAGIDQSNEAFDAMGKLEGKVNIKPILDTFAKAKSKLVVDRKVIDSVHFRALEDVEKTISQYGDSVPAESLRKIKTIFDKKIAKSGKGFGLTLSDTDALEARKIGANAIRDLLAEKYPKADEINRTFTFFKNLDDVLTSTTLRKTGQSGLLRKAAGTVTGAVIGSPLGPAGSAVGAEISKNLATIGNSVWFKTGVSAKLKNAVAEMLLNSDYSVTKIAKILENPSIVGVSPGFLAGRMDDVIQYLKENAKADDR